METEDILRALQNADRYGKMEEFEKICGEMEDERRKEMLTDAPYAPYKGSDGYWYVYLAKPEGGRLKRKRKTRKEIEDVVIDYYGDGSDRDPTIRETFAEWNAERVKSGDIKPGTGDREWDTFNRHFKKIQDERIGNMTPEMWDLFLQKELSGHKLYQRAWGNLKALCKGLIMYARQHGYISYYPDDVLKGISVGRHTFKERVKSDQEDSFSLDERWAVIDYITEKDERTIHELGVLLLFVCGLRIGELAALKYEDIKDGKIHVRRTETRHKVNGHWRYDVDDRPKTIAGDRWVPIPDDYQWILKEAERIAPEEPYIFTYRGKRVTACGFRKQVYKLCDEVGIARKGPHKARKTYLSILFENDVPAYLIERMAGHTDIQTSKEFYLRQVGYQREADVVNQIPELQRHKAKDPNDSKDDSSTQAHGKEMPDNVG